MGREKCSKWMRILVTVVFLMMMGRAASESWGAEEKYPYRLIQVVVCYQPGDTDAALRPFIEKLPEFLSQPLAFVYKPGGAGAVGGSFVAKAKPDGYTLIGTSPSPIIICPLTKEGLDYTLDDFAPICLLVSSPQFLVVKSDSPWKTANDMVKDAKKSPGKLTYGTSGVFGTPHLGALMFLKSAGINLTHVPLAGTGPATAALLGGHLDMVCSSMPPIIGHLRSGTLRPLVVLDKERLKEFPDCPTASELGYPVIWPTWYGLLAPRGTPKEVINTLNKACEKLIDVHKNFINDRLEKLSLKENFLNTEEFANKLKANNEAIKKILKDFKEPIK